MEVEDLYEYVEHRLPSVTLADLVQTDFRQAVEQAHCYQISRFS